MFFVRMSGWSVRSTCLILPSSSIVLFRSVSLEALAHVFMSHSIFHYLSMYMFLVDTVCSGTRKTEKICERTGRTLQMNLELL